MSQRALKKREHSLHKTDKETYQIYRKQSQSLMAQKFKYTQRTHANAGPPSSKQRASANQCDEYGHSRVIKQKFSSTPNLATINEDDADNQDLVAHRNEPQRSHSESDLTTIPENNVMAHAKSEFHLKSIASTQVTLPKVKVKKPVAHLSMDGQLNKQSKRTSLHCGLNSQMSASMSTSSFHLPPSPSTDLTDASANIRIPIVGYEVMEERARFTVYKLRVENPFTNDCWMVLRRYTDFQRLNNKLKSTFPHLPPLALPRKKLFGDNFSSMFLGNRVQGLQQFINAVLANKMLRHSKPVRDFFCLDEPPTYSESIEECRAIFEAQEDTINHLKTQLRAKDETIDALKKQLNSEIEKNCALSTAIKFSYDNCPSCSKRFDDLMKCKMVIGNSN